MITNSFIRVLDSLYERLIKWSSSLQSLFLFWMRLTWGPQFFVMGMEKISNISKSEAFFSSLGYTHPLFATYLVGYIELIGGFLLIIGFASRLAAIPLLCTTIAIMTRAHTSSVSEWALFTHPSLVSHQPPYPYLIIALLILIFGPGKISLDAWVKRRIQKKKSQHF